MSAGLQGFVFIGSPERANYVKGNETAEQEKRAKRVLGPFFPSIGKTWFKHHCALC